jgi:hypothetical protein
VTTEAAQDASQFHSMKDFDFHLLNNFHFFLFNTMAISLLQNHFQKLTHEHDAKSTNSNHFQLMQRMGIDSLNFTGFTMLELEHPRKTIPSMLKRDLKHA